ncbi:hypothetical protein HDU97_000871 [Phlyctochytrium planicorne]|nr:hypothetical protein HDU97_000871 [Phlyctochytrium planicorne]
MIRQRSNTNNSVSSFTSSSSGPMAAAPPQQLQQQQQPTGIMRQPAPAAQPPEVAVSIQEFFTHFVVPQYGPPPAPLSPDDLKSICISFISSARLSPRDVRFTEEGSGTVWLSHRGLRVLENFVEMKRVGTAAITIQKVYRGFKARKRVALMREGEVEFEEVEEIGDDGMGGAGGAGAHLAVPGRPSQIAKVSNRGSIIVDEVELKRLSVGSAFMATPPSGSRRSSQVQQGDYYPQQPQQRQPQPQQQQLDNEVAYIPVEDGGYTVVRTYSNGSQHKPPGEDRDRAERRRSKVMAFKRHLMNISQAYQDIIQGSDPNSAGTPSDREIQFMKLLNSEETFRLSTNLRALHKIERPATLEEAQKHYEEQGGVPGGRTPAQMYQEYSARVVEWISIVVPHYQPQISPTVDLVQLLRSGDLLCELAVSIYPRVQCQLLSKGPEFTIHKIIFFLELCKTIGIKPSMLFSVQDLLLGGPEHDPVRKSALTVLRTVCALERQARRRGWNGPVMVLKPEGIEAKRRSSKGSTNAPGADGEATQDPRNSRRLSQNRRSRTPTRNTSTSPHRSVASKTSSSSFKDNGSINGSQKRLSRRISGTGASLNAQSTRESLYGFYGGANNAGSVVIQSQASGSNQSSQSDIDLDAVARAEYEEMLATVKEKERIEEEAERDRVEREMEEEERKRAVSMERETIRAFWEGMRRRNRSIGELLASEETFVHNMTAISDFLSQLLYRRRRESKRHSRGLPPLESGGSQEDLSESETPSTHDPYLPLEGETQTRANLRVESENEDLALLDRVVADIVILHSDLISDLRACLDAAAMAASNAVPPGDAGDDSEEGDGWMRRYQQHALANVGEVMMRFASDLSSPYITYAVVTSAKATGESSDGSPLFDRGSAGGLPPEIFAKSQDGLEFNLKVVQRFMGETPPSSSSVLTPEEWRWYLERPLRRLAEYKGLVETISENWKLPASSRPISMMVGDAKAVEDVQAALSKERVKGSLVEAGVRKAKRDDRRLDVAGVKISCVSKAVEAQLGA